MINIKAIIQGWGNYAFAETTSEHLHRAEICAQCQHAVHGEMLDRIKDEIVVIQGYKCDICSCPLSAKIRQDSERCPQNKW